MKKFIYFVVLPCLVIIYKPGKPDTKNHYVALCQPVVISSGQRHFKPVLPNVDIPVSDEDSGAKPATLHEDEAPTATLNQPRQTRKRRQLSLDQLFPNKRNPSFMVTTSSEETSTVDSNLVERATIGKQSTTSNTNGSNPPSQCLSQSCSVPNDIGNYISRAASFTNQDKYNLLCNVWQPDAAYTFPMNKAGRRFQYKCLTIFPWPTYSAVANGAYCIHCVRFAGESCHNATKLQRLFKTPLIASKPAVRKITEHAEKSLVHQTATLQALQFKQLMEQKTAPIDVQLDRVKLKQVEENRKRLRPIVDAIILYLNNI